MEIDAALALLARHDGTLTLRTDDEGKLTVFASLRRDGRDLHVSVRDSAHPTMRRRLSRQVAAAVDELVDLLEGRPTPAAAAVAIHNVATLSPRTFRLLESAGLTTLGQIAKLGENDLLTIRGFGIKTLLEVRDVLAAHGLAFRSHPDFSPA